MRSVLSSPRFNTYFEACDGDHLRAGQLYSWNASLSAALLVPAHFAEVSTRNAAANILEATYGPEWPWEEAFAISLPSPAKRYSPRRDLQAVRKQYSTTGKAIAELKLAFWSSLLPHDTMCAFGKIVFPQHFRTLLMRTKRNSGKKYETRLRISGCSETA